MTSRPWGYERADCSGDYALSLFLDDMERVVDHYATQASEEPLETRLFRAQAAANKLLQAYDKNARKTDAFARSEEHTSELQSLMRISYAVFCLNKQKPHNI